jgi:nucleoid DNA-binding protein
MNDLARAIAEENNCKTALAREIVDTVFRLLRERLIEGNRIEIRGFGALSVKVAAPKPNARNPRTGEIFFVPARRKVRFKTGLDLRKPCVVPVSMRMWSITDHGGSANRRTSHRPPAAV